MRTRRGRLGALALALALTACGRSSSTAEPGAEADDAAAAAPPMRPEAAAAEQRLGTTLARLAGRERAGVFQRCPPADERFDAAMAALAQAAVQCADEPASPAACDPFLARLRGPPPETIGCRYLEPPAPGGAPDAPEAGAETAVVWRALSRVIGDARDRAQAAGEAVADAARLTARAIRIAALLLRSDDPRAWLGVGDLARWVTRLGGWLDGLPDDAAAAVRVDLEATRGAWLDADLATRLLLLREADRGRATGGLEGGVHEEAALVTLEAIAAGSDMASVRAEIDAMASGADGAMRAAEPRSGPPRELSPRERGLVLIVVRQRIAREVGALIARHHEATEALSGLPR